MAHHAWAWILALALITGGAGWAQDSGPVIRSSDLDEPQVGESAGPPVRDAEDVPPAEPAPPRSAQTGPDPSDSPGPGQESSPLPPKEVQQNAAVETNEQSEPTTYVRRGHGKPVAAFWIILPPTVN